MKYFKYSEFDSPDVPGSGSRMKTSTLKKLDKAREYAGVPFIVLSGYRTYKHNKEVGGVAGSAHTKGYAADILASPENYGKILTGLIKAGFKRIGLNAGSIHADDDPGKPSPSVWIYHYTDSFKRLKTLVLRAVKNGDTTILSGIAIALLIAFIFLKNV